jgi:hypothetical protein
MNKGHRLFLAAILTVMLIIGGCFWYFVWPGYLYEVRWRDRTNPLRSDVIFDLCTSFSLTEDNRLCRPSEVVYGPDFFPIIKNTFLPEGSSRIATYEEVEKRLGNYLVKCGSNIRQADGDEYFICEYDLQGDGVFPITIVYSKSGLVLKLFNETGIP